MPVFDEDLEIGAAPEEVWKLLYDPGRFPEWMEGLASVADVRAQDGGGTYTQYPDGYPDFPMPQRLRTDRQAGRVVVSCLVSDLEYRWTLAEADDGRGTRLAVRVAIPDAEAHRLEAQRQGIRASLQRLGRLAEAPVRDA